MATEFKEVVNCLTQTIIDNEDAANYSHREACTALNIDPQIEIGGSDLPEDDPRYEEYYRLSTEAFQELLTSVKANLTNPPTVDVAPLDAIEGANLLEHYTKWLEANRLLRQPRTEIVTKGSATPEAVLVHRYQELQWGEDREAEWGHAFDV